MKMCNFLNIVTSELNIKNQELADKANYRVAFQSRRFNSKDELVKNNSLVLKLGDRGFY